MIGRFGRSQATSCEASASCAIWPHCLAKPSVQARSSTSGEPSNIGIQIGAHVLVEDHEQDDEILRLLHNHGFAAAQFGPLCASTRPTTCLALPARSRICCPPPSRCLKFCSAMSAPPPRNGNPRRAVLPLRSSTFIENSPRRLVLNLGIALGLECKRQFLAAGLHYAALGEHVPHVG